MEVSLDGIWSTPSTLHLTVVIRGKGDSWIAFKRVAVPLDDLPPATVRHIVECAGQDSPDQPLPGLG